MSIILLLWVISSLWYGQSCRLTRQDCPTPIRSGLIQALLLTTFAVVALTESLTRSALLNTPTLVIAWGLLAICTTGWAVFQYRQRHRLILFRWAELSGFEQSLLVITAAILSLTLLTAFLYPPNNFDSLTYHMARVAHWALQHSVQPFATHIERQLYQPPLAEWMILHTVMLSQSDLWASTVQWVAGVGCLTAVSLFARQMGSSRVVQIAAVFVAATIPMVILQLSSTQNDLVVSFYLMVVVIYLLQYYRDRQIGNMGWAGLALGFAFLTKGTAYLLSAPVLLTWGLLEVERLVRPEGRGVGAIRSAFRLMLPVLILVTISLGLNAGHYARNLRIYNHPLTDTQTQNEYVNQTHSAPMMVSNVSRNLALHFGFPGFHWLAQQGVERLHKWMQLDVRDYDTTYMGSAFDLPMLSNNEDNASNFLHSLWLVWSVFWLIRYSRHLNRRPYFILVGMLFVTFLMFCAYLKWQPWHSRQHTFMFLMASPLAAVALVSAHTYNHRWPVWLLAASAAGFVLTNPFRPFITLPPLTQPVSFVDERARNYFLNDTTFIRAYDQIRPILDQQPRDSLRIGLLLGENDFDYVWYQYLKPPIRLHHVRIQTPSRLLDTHPAVDYIISMQTWGDTLHYQDGVYWRMQPKTGRIALFGQR